MAREWRGPYPSKPAVSETPRGGAWTPAFDGKVLIRADGQCLIMNPVLCHILLIHEYYRARDERMVVLQNDLRHPSPGHYLVSISAPPKSFETKVRVKDHVVCEYGREEMI